MLEASFNALQTLFAEIAHVIGGNNSLDIGCEASTARAQIEAFMGEANVDVLIQQFPHQGPIGEVAGRAVDFMHDEAGTFPAPEPGNDFVEDRPTALSGRFLLFVPGTDNKTML
ncbi:MAG: hypothetical protein AAFY73_14660 [Pseudomonadota bacterium]